MRWCSSQAHCGLRLSLGWVACTTAIAARRSKPIPTQNDCYRLQLPRSWHGWRLEIGFLTVKKRPDCAHPWLGKGGYFYRWHGERVRRNICALQASIQLGFCKQAQNFSLCSCDEATRRWLVAPRAFGLTGRSWGKLWCSLHQAPPIVRRSPSTLSFG